MASCVTQAKEAHQTDQTDQPSPDTDHLTSGPTKQSTSKTVGFGAKGGLADPTWQPPRLSFGGKLDLILLKVVDHVSIQGDGGN